MTCEEIICIILATAGSIIAIMVIYFGISFCFNAAFNNEDNKDYYKEALDKTADERDFYRDSCKNLRIYNHWLQNQLKEKENEPNRS